jgi:SAM-dependent methyltransferase
MKFRTEKSQFILDLCKGRRVMDVGCVNHDIESTRAPDWRHRQVKKVASQLVGLDYAREAVNKLNKEGWEIQYADAQNFDLTAQYPEKFDVILAADVIEHLPNPGAFLTCARKHLSPNGIVIIATPHAHSFAYFLEILCFGEERVNDTHTMTFSRKNMQVLLTSSGLYEKEFHWLIEDSSKWATGTKDYLLKKAFLWIQYIVVTLTRAAFAKEMVVLATENLKDADRPKDEPIRLQRNPR